MKHIRTIIGCVAALMLTSCAGRTEESYRKCAGSIWATTYHITYSSPRDLTDSIFAVMARVEDSLSPFDKESLISAINRGETTRTDTLLRRIFSASAEVNRLSHGAFDPTVAPLVNLWGFGYRDTDMEPTPDDIARVLARVGIQRCRLQGDSLVAPEGTEFNFSAITKGYACDLIGEMLRRNGCADYLVEIGGEMAVSGSNPRGSKWQVMIDAPVENDTVVTHSRAAVIAIDRGGVATSGNYRNYRFSASQGKVWHTISPADGYPARTTTLSATVLAPDAMTADALATACMSMCSDSAIAMIGRVADTEALLIEADSTGFRLHPTPGFPL